MYKKLIITALALTSLSVYAATGKGYREYGEEFHSTPGANFHVEEVPLGTVDAMARKENAMSGKTTTQVPNRIGRVNENVIVDGYHHFTITNNTTLTQIYEIYISLECGDMHSFHTRYVNIEPGGSYTCEDHTSGSIKPFAPGGFRIIGKSKLTGESNDSSQSSGTLYVAM